MEQAGTIPAVGDAHLSRDEGLKPVLTHHLTIRSKYDCFDVSYRMDFVYDDQLLFSLF